MSKRRSLMSSKVHVKLNGEIMDSWAQIIANIHAGKHKELYAPGNYKKMDLGNDGVLNCVLIGFDKDYKPSGGTAPTSWFTKELTKVTTARPLHPFMSVQGEYGSKSQARGGLKSVLDGTIKPKMPEVVRNNLVTVRKSFYAQTWPNPSDSYPSYWYQKYSNSTELFVPNQTEMTNGYLSAMGSSAKIKCVAGETSPSEWPLRDNGYSRDVGASYTTEWHWKVDTSGAVNKNNNNYTYYHIPIGFCL